MKNNRMHLPKNIRQIGETDKYNKIYVEDYVITYLRQIAASEELGSKAVALLGSKESENEYSYYFIYGAVCTEKMRLEEGKPLFDQEDKKYILDKKNEYFPDDEIVGWVLLENEFNRVTDDGIWKNGKDEFSNENKLFLRSDVSTNNEIWKVYNSGIQKTIPGYAIFYDKNDAMQSYLVEWHKQRSDTSIENVKDVAARQFRSIITDKQQNNYQQKAMSIFYIASTMLMIVLCVTGISMLNHYQKMKDMETAINHLVQAMDEPEGSMALPAMETDIGILLDEENAAAILSENAVNHIGEQGNTNENMTDKEQDAPSEQTQTDVATQQLNPEPAAVQQQENLESAAQQQETAEPAAVQQQENLESAAQQQETAEPAAVQQQENLELAVQQQENPEPAGIEQQAEPAVYIVQKGDTLVDISKSFYKTSKKVDEICILNNIENSNSIMVGQKILLP